MGSFDGNPQLARRMFNRMCGLHRAAFWREQGFPNCARARAVWRKQRHELLLEQWKREEQRRTPFAVLDDEVPSYQELAARFKVPYGRRPAELRSLQRRK
jgi:hypothetical protein